MKLGVLELSDASMRSRASDSDGRPLHDAKKKKRRPERKARQQRGTPAVMRARYAICRFSANDVFPFRVPLVGEVVFYN